MRIGGRVAAAFIWSSIILTMPIAGAVKFEAPAGAFDAEDPLILAGYRALFTCSAHFFMGRPLDGIRKLELVDTVAFNFPDPEIDTERQLVTARSSHGHTAIAAYRPTMGCTILPTHWGIADVPRLPYIAYPEKTHANSAYPLGDQINVKANRAVSAIVSDAFSGDRFGEGTVTVGVLVVHKGKVIAERYRDGFGPHSGYRTWSTAKSITATLIGIAVADGLINIDDPAPIPEWQFGKDPRQAITWRNLLHMSSGLYSQGANTNAIYFAGQDVISAATTTPLDAEPGKRWKYANNDTLLLLRALRHVLADDHAYLRFPYDRLFHTIGMFNTRMETDYDGNFVGSSQVYTTLRDLGRFALLYLNQGRWQGERLLPDGWTTFVATPAPSRPPVAGEQGYGAQFWLFDQIAGVPKGAYSSAGNKGQYATVVPDRDLVVVRTGIDPNGVRWNQPKLVAEVSAALD